MLFLMGELVLLLKLINTGWTHQSKDKEFLKSSVERELSTNRMDPTTEKILLRKILTTGSGRNLTKASHHSLTQEEALLLRLTNIGWTHQSKDKHFQSTTVCHVSSLVFPKRKTTSTLMLTTDIGLTLTIHLLSVCMTINQFTANLVKLERFLAGHPKSKAKNNH